MSTDVITWLPEEWSHPVHVPVGPDHHLRPLRASDVDLDLLAVSSSRARLWSIYGLAWGWPPAGLTREQDLVELTRVEAEIEAHEAFDYGLFDHDETALLGCVYLDPTPKAGADADVSWWVVDALVGSELESRLASLVPAWVAAEWPLVRPRFVGHDLSWDDWLDLPDVAPPLP